MGGPTQLGLESTISPSAPARTRYRPTPAELSSLVRLPRRKFNRVAVAEPASASSVFCSPALRLDHSNGMPILLVPSQVSMTRLAAAGVAAVGPATLVEKHPPPADGSPAVVPVSMHAASQLAVVLTVTTPAVSISVFAVTVPVQSPGL